VIRIVSLIRLLCGISCLFAAVMMPAAVAQSTGKLADSPILIMRNDGINTRTMMEYVQSVSNDLKIGTNILRMMEREEVESMLSQHPDPASGSMTYMVQGLVPAVEQIEFTQVVDQAEFERLVRSRARQTGDSVTLTGSDDRFKYVFQSSWQEPVSEAELTQDGATENQVQVGISLGSSGAGVRVNNGIDQDSEIVEEDGRKFRRRTFSVTQYFRFHEGFMFTSSYEDLFTTQLPSRETLLGGRATENDAELQFYPDRIPVGFKHLFWSTISAAAGSELQQRDEEDEIDYQVRRSGGDLGLAIIKTLLFDTEMISGSFRLADATEPVRGDLRLAARENSGFSADLKELASSTSRFAPVLSDDAAGTIHLAFKLSDGSRGFLTSLGQWIRVRLSEAADRDVDLAIAGSEIEESLAGIAEHGTLEAFVKIGWTNTSDGVIYGGVQVDDNPQLLRNLFALMTGDDVPADVAERFSIVQHSDLEFIEFRVPDLPAEVPIRATHVYVCHAERCLWVATGSDRSWDILRQSIERCRNATGLRRRTPLLTAEIDLAHWMAFPQDDPTGIAGLPKWGDRELNRLRSQSYVGRTVDQDGNLTSIKGSNSTTPADLMQRVVDLGGSQSAGLRVLADESGVQLEGNLGAVIGRYAIAQWLTTIDAALAGFGPAQTDEEATEVDVPKEIDQ
jgi:hypothetical protein